MKCPFCIKKCKICGKILVACVDNFYKKNRGKYGFRAECKTCWRNKQKVYHNEHVEERKEYRQQYYIAHQDELKARAKEYRDTHVEERKKYNKEYREKNQERLSTYLKDWRKNNTDKTFNYNVNRRIKEESQGRGITDEQFLEMMEYFNWCCAYSGKRFSGRNKDGDRSIDHIIPINKGGKHEPYNCIPMYMPYNSSKNDSDMLEWYKLQDFYSEERLQKIYSWQEYAYKKWGN